MRFPRLLPAASLILLACGTSAFAGPQNVNILTNGDFDTGPGGSSVSTQFGSAGYAGLAGWSVASVNGSTPFDLWWNAATASSISAQTQYGNSGQELVASAPGSDGGNPHFVSLDGDPNASGSLSQTVNNLVVGDHYQLSFDWAATQMTTGSQHPYTIGVAFNLGSGSLTGTQGMPQTGVLNEAYGASSGWMTVTYDFTATASSEVLSFLSFGTPVGGPPIALLDNIALDDIPEPSSLAVIAGGLLLCGLTIRRRGNARAS
jgi:hypothetical protein